MIGKIKLVNINEKVDRRIAVRYDLGDGDVWVNAEHLFAWFRLKEEGLREFAEKASTHKSVNEANGVMGCAADLARLIKEAKE